MSVLNVNGHAVIACSLRMPRRGTWVADVIVDTAEAVSDRVTLASFDGRLTLVGAVERGAVAAGAWHGRLVGGAGGLANEVAPQSYRSLPLRTPLEDALQSAGEALSTTADPAVLGTILPSWSRERASAAAAVANLVEAAKASWRVLPDGTVWVGRDAWPAAPLCPYDTLEEDPAQGYARLGVEAPWLMPGVTLGDRRVSFVLHTVSTAGVRTDVWFERASEGARLLDTIRRVLRKMLTRVDYLALYPARVVAQNGDLSLELRPDGDSMPPISRVPLRVPLPDVKLRVLPGARVLLAFESGDPRRPIATLWEGDGLVELQLGGARPIARQGDQVVLTMPPMMPITGTVTPPLPSGSTFVGTLTLNTTLIGAILTGSGKVKA